MGALPRRRRRRRRPRRRAAQGPRLRARRRRRGRGRGHRQPRRPRHPAPLHRPRDGPGRAADLARGQAGHRTADRERLLLRLRRRDPLRARGPRQDRVGDAQDHQGEPALRASGHHRRRRPRRAEGRALQDRADRAQGRRRCGRHRGRERRGRRRRAHHLRQHRPQRRGQVVRPVPRPAPAHHQADPRLQADAQCRGLLARRREEQAAPADLRHRVGVQGGPRGPPRADRRGREARPPQARPRPRPVLLPRRDRLRPAGLPPQGWRDQARDGGLRPPPAHRGGLRLRRHPPHLQGGDLPPLGTPALLQGHDVPADGVRGRGLLPQGHELPDAQPDLPLARSVLPRAAAAALRVRPRLPLREVRRDPRPDPRARLRPGRLALLRHRGAGARRDHAPARLRARPAARLRPRRLLPRALDPRRLQARQVRRLRGAVGQRDRRAAHRLRGVRPRAGARPGRRRVLRPEGVGAGQGRDRPHLADVDHPVRLQPAAGLRPDLPGRRRHPQAAGDDPLGQVRLDRALPRRARRALRRCLPALARARPGAGDPGRRLRRRLPPRRRAPDEGAGAARRGRRLRRPDAEEDPQRAAAEGAVHGHRRQRRHRGRAVSFRYRDGRQDNGVPIDEAIQRVADAVAAREQV